MSARAASYVQWMGGTLERYRSSSTRGREKHLMSHIQRPPPALLVVLLLNVDLTALPSGLNGLSARRSHLLYVTFTGTISRESKVVRNEVEVLTPWALDDDHTFLIGVFAKSLGHTLLAYGAVEFDVFHGLQVDDFLCGDGVAARSS